MTFRDLIHHFKSMKVTFLVAVIVFIGGFVVGALPNEVIHNYLLQNLKGISTIAKKLMESDHPQLYLFILIFINNTLKALVMVFVGAGFGIIPVLFLFFNGMVLGFVSVNEIQHASLFALMKGILPHGIIEIPVIILACAYGMRLGSILWRGITHRGEFKDNIVPFLKLTVPLSGFIIVALFVAAIIESTITFWLVHG